MTENVWKIQCELLMELVEEQDKQIEELIEIASKSLAREEKIHNTYTKILKDISKICDIPGVIQKQLDQLLD